MHHNNEEMLSLYRTAMKTAADMTSALVVDAERVLGFQAQAVRDACLAQAEAARQFERATSPQELFAIQARIAGAQMEKAMSYWSGLCAAGDPDRMEIFKCARQGASATPA